ncbi:MAG: PAS domain-containing protein [Gemmatimonadota bacterium]
MAVLDNLPDLIFLKDLDSRFVVASEPLAQIFGISATEMIGKTDLDFFSADQAARFALDDKLVLQSGERLIVELLSTISSRMQWSGSCSIPLPAACSPMRGRSNK